MAQQVQGKTAKSRARDQHPPGINLEFARLLLQHGANVLFSDLALRPEAEDLVYQYQSTANKGLFQKTDVTSWPDLNAMFKTAQEAFGSIDIVCPGAGVFEPHWSNFWYPPGSAKSGDDPLGGRYKLLDINLTHPIRITQMAISHFLAASPPPASTSNPKSIVHIASIAGQTASLPVPLHHVSKHGVQALVRSLASLEQSHGIRVTAVKPGVVKTPLWTENPEKLRMVKVKRDDGGGDGDAWVTPEEVAQVMLACVKDDEIDSVSAGGGSSGLKEQMVPIKGGTCLEVLAGSVRDVPMYNNIGPYATGRPGASASDSQKLVDEVMDVLKPGWGQV
ncbi:3-hydroxybutyrate dehydrogenase [Capronia coronata CBS 617.96]|uniref:3-hydroxybutyrate dehydrogenase n=1 Tax=Capronia coronata CBS 617.96 TaxID=1182541 RepID=W9XSL1_9EURO|nr:3-hydroxybutyrate dehydrogenase [Capronia coronata CBS 617.96]EXJ80325.1 3-hydroxybutyrate dehydrogenase [Capronia coronata CBS 617.96]